MTWILTKKLSSRRLEVIEQQVTSSFESSFWRPANVRRVIRDLVAHIRYLERKLARNRRCDGRSH